MLRLRHARLLLPLALLAPPALSQGAPVLEGPVWTYTGDATVGAVGHAVASAGDVNGDGYDDVIVGAPYSSDGQEDEGRAFVFLGSASGLASAPGWTLEVDRRHAQLGYSVAGVGDVNGDGFDDVLVGAPGASDPFFEAGAALLFLGSTSGLSAAADWVAKGTQTYEFLGRCVAGAGDVNGDGYDDLLVGAPGFDSQLSTAGRALLFLGSPAGPSAQPDWSFESDQDSSYLGGALACAGDVNADGFDDIVVGVPAYRYVGYPSGQVLVFHGSAAGLSPTPDWTAFHLQQLAKFGASVDGAGDVDGDGFDDLLIGAPGIHADQIAEGRVFLYRGSAGGLAGVPAWTHDGGEQVAHLGMCVAGLGDIDGDGFDDVLAASKEHQDEWLNQGRALAFLGRPGGLESSPSWTALGEQSWGWFGASGDGAGDVDGDGLADMVLGAPGEAPAGRARLWLGLAFADCNANGVSDSLEIWSGTSGDCNGNGVPDECDLATGPSVDCNANGVPDDCDLRAGTSADRNGNEVPDECEAAGEPYCSGDGSATACPCSNPGAPGHGCANGSSPTGALLGAVGSGSVALDELLLFVEGSAPLQPGLFLQGDERLGAGAGLAFGDGLRCAGGAVVRLQVRTADAAGSTVSTGSLVQRGGVAAGDTRHYQWWYRDPLGSPCGQRFNLSNGLTIDWQP